MNLPDGWIHACEESEAKLKDYTPLNPINAQFCLETVCPGLKILEISTPWENKIYTCSCMFSKCLKRYPSRRELKYMK